MDCIFGQSKTKLYFQFETKQGQGFYEPGDEVRGAVFLELKQPIVAKSMTVRFVGEVTLRGQESVTSERVEAGFPALESSGIYVNNFTTLWGAPNGWQVGNIPEGLHRFPFRFSLPENCQSSFKGRYGRIRYYGQAKIIKPWYLCDDVKYQEFEVRCPKDLTMIPHLALQVQFLQQRINEQRYSESAKIDLTVKLHKTGIVPDEGFPVKAEVFNFCSKMIEKITITLVQRSRYGAQRQGNVLHTSRFAEKCITIFTEKLCVPRGAHHRFMQFVRLPQVVASMDSCPTITVEYFLKITVSTGGIIKYSATTFVPITVGTVPIRNLSLSDMLA